MRGPVDVYVYRSDDNGHTWKVLNLDDPVRHADWYLDDDFPEASKFAVTAYRLLVVDADGTKLPTEPVAVYSALDGRQYGLASAVVKRKFRYMKTAGVAVWHATPLRQGDPCPGYDGETRQNTGVPCPGDGCYGQPFVGGFAPPMRTWLRFDGNPVTDVSEDTSVGSVEKRIVRAEMLPWPKPVVGDLVVEAFSDDRYAVGGKITGKYFRGTAPLSWSVELHMLDRNDPRQGFPVPAEWRK